MSPNTDVAHLCNGELGEILLIHHNIQLQWDSRQNVYSVSLNQHV